MHRRFSVAVVTVLMLSSLAGAMVPYDVSGPTNRPIGDDAEDHPLKQAHAPSPMSHNSSDGGKYDALGYELFMSLDMDLEEVDATCNVSLRGLRDMDQLNLTLLGSLTVSWIEDDGNNMLSFFHNTTLDLLTVNLSSTVGAGQGLNLTIRYYGNMSRAHADDMVSWEGAMLERVTPWYPVPDRYYGFDDPRPRSLDLHNLTVHAVVPDNWTVVAAGHYQGESLQGGLKNVTYRSDGWVRGYSLAAGEYWENTTTHAGITVSTHMLEQNQTQSGKFIDRAVSVLDWFNSNYGQFPYDQYRIVEVPEVPGNLFLSDQGLTLTDTFDSTYPSMELTRVMAEQYFLFSSFALGDYDLWLTHSFSEYATMYYQIDELGTNSRLRANLNGYGSGQGDRSIDEIRTTDSRYRQVIECKGSYVLHMMRYLIGDSEFSQIMQSYITHINGNTVTLDTFLDEVHQVTAQDLAWFFDVWLNTTDILDYSVSTPSPFIYMDDGQMKLEVTVTKESDIGMPVDLMIEFDSGSTENHTSVVSRDDYQETLVFNVSGAVSKVVLDPQYWLLDVDDNDNEDQPYIYDLRVTDISISPPSGIVARDMVTIRTSVENTGTGTFSPVVEFYDNGNPIATRTVQDLAPTDEEDLQVEWYAVAGHRNLSVMIDSDEVIREYNETNNWINTTVFVKEYVPPPDLFFVGNITMSRENVTEGDAVLLNATLFNDYKRVLTGATVEFHMDGDFLGNTTLGPIQPRDTGVASFTWITEGGIHVAKAIAHVPSGMQDNNTDNNEVENQLTVNIKPSALLEVDDPTPFTGVEVEFSATGSYDDGTIVSYSFDFGDGTMTNWSSEATVTHAYATSGGYDARVKVRDDLGAESPWSDPVEMEVQNTMPEADFEVYPGLEGTVNTVFSFVPNATDPDGEIVEYFWDFGDMKTTNTKSPTHKYKDDKEFTVRLAVTDTDGQSSEPVTKTVIIKNLPPRIDASVDRETVYVNAPVVLDASDSWDPDDLSSQLSFRWSDGSRTLSTKDRATGVTFLSPGEVTITLTVTDDDDATNSTTFTLTVEKLPDTNGGGEEEDNTMLYVAAGGGGLLVVIVLLVLFMMMRGKKREAEEPEIEKRTPAGKKGKKGSKRKGKKGSKRKGKKRTPAGKKDKKGSKRKGKKRTPAGKKGKKGSKRKGEKRAPAGKKGEEEDEPEDEDEDLEEEVEEELFDDDEELFDDEEGLFADEDDDLFDDE